jgi:hypothetical protein
MTKVVALLVRDMDFAPDDYPCDMVNINNIANESAAISVQQPKIGLQGHTSPSIHGA